MISQMLLLAAVVWPGLMLLGCVSGFVRKRVGGLMWCGPAPALTAGLWVQDGASIAVLDLPFQISLGMDQTGRILLIAASLLWVAAGIYAPTWFRKSTMKDGFVVCWLATLTGSLGIFLASNLMGFLVFYAMVSLPAYGFVISDGTPFAKKAGAVYMGFALLGENLLLLAFVILAGLTLSGNTQISVVVGLISTSPMMPVVLVLVLLGFGMKMALLPMHFWMPPSYASAPIPAAAVMSGAAVKAGVLGLLRFLPMEAPLPAWGNALIWTGLAGAFFGVAVGLTQNNPKSVLAYSSVSQMGFLAALSGTGLASGDPTVIPLAAFYAAHHVLVKGGLFLALGVAMECGTKKLGLVRWPGLIVGLGLAGLPLTGGALAKLASKDPISSTGYDLVAILASLSAAGTAALMLHFLKQTLTSHHSRPEKSAPAGMMLPWLAVALACVLLPWALFPWSGLESPREVFALTAIWKTLWPILIGVLIFLFLKSRKLPGIPCGDIFAWSAVPKLMASGVASMLTHVDAILKKWAPACLALLLVVLCLTAAMVRFSH
jgi:formate hydrogenlyase subunit 3/multisubunit Na+/H+ antiporter MnhD subunit